MAADRAGRVALMAIQPEYSQAILEGTKKVEFRKRALASDVRTVLIYETAPTQRVVGEFSFDEVVTGRPEQLWLRFGEFAGIKAKDFAKYYEGCAAAVALSITAACRYADSIALWELHPQPAIPQSFTYLSCDALDQVRNRQLSGSPISRQRLLTIG
jgi:predicted transcriptional regulator